MSVGVIQGFIGAAIAFGAAVFHAHSGQETAIGHKNALDDQIRRYRQDAANRKGAGGTAQSALAELQLAEDEAWYARETKILDEWLDRPIYRQLGFVPFPDYANVK